MLTGFHEGAFCFMFLLFFQDLRDSPLRSNMAARKKTPRTTGRKRKSCELEVGRSLFKPIAVVV